MEIEVFFIQKEGKAIKMKDFFVSYTGNDLAYATWVAEILEANNYTVVIQEWDFRPGDNFVSKINESLLECEKLLVILSESYIASKWCEAEWTAKMAEQINLNERRIIPIRIAPVNLTGLLSPIVYIDIVDKSEEQAKQAVLDGVSNKQQRRSTEGYPSFYNIEHIHIDNDYYVSDDCIIYIKSCRSRVLKEGFNKLHNRITWFVDEKIKLSSLTKGIDIQYLDLRDTNLNYNVVFNRSFRKGEVFDFRIKAILTNDNHHFANFFSTEVIAPIENLSIHLNLEDKSIKKYYTQKLSSSPMNVRTEPPEEHLLQTPVHWNIQKPELNFEYKIFW